MGARSGPGPIVARTFADSCTVIVAVIAISGPAGNPRYRANRHWRCRAYQPCRAWSRVRLALVASIVVASPQSNIRRAGAHVCAAGIFRLPSPGPMRSTGSKPFPFDRPFRPWRPAPYGPPGRFLYRTYSFLPAKTDTAGRKSRKRGRAAGIPARFWGSCGVWRAAAAAVRLGPWNIPQPRVRASLGPGIRPVVLFGGPVRCEPSLPSVAAPLSHAPTTDRPARGGHGRARAAQTLEKVRYGDESTKALRAPPGDGRTGRGLDDRGRSGHVPAEGRLTRIRRCCREAAGTSTIVIGRSRRS